MSLHSRIATARRLAGLSQVELARQMGIHRSAVTHWESSKGRNPTMAHLRHIAEVTQVMFEWLATGRGPMALTESVRLDSVPAAEALLVYEPAEMRLMQAFRDAPVKGQIALLELAEQLAAQRVGRARASKAP